MYVLVELVLVKTILSYYADIFQFFKLTPVRPAILQEHFLEICCGLATWTHLGSWCTSFDFGSEFAEIDEFSCILRLLSVRTNSFCVLGQCAEIFSNIRN
jgi:hypothetical protein